CGSAGTRPRTSSPAVFRSRREPSNRCTVRRCFHNRDVDESVLRRSVAEFVGTFTLIFIGGGAGIASGQDIVAVALANGLAIGIMVSNLGHIDVLMGGPLTGAAMNPARALGPELVGNFWGEGWIYWLGPIVGALVAAFLYVSLYLRPARPSVVGTPESGVVEPRPGETALE